MTNYDLIDDLQRSHRLAVESSARTGKMEGWCAEWRVGDEATTVLAKQCMTVTEPSAQLRRGMEAVRQTTMEKWVDRAGESISMVLKSYAAGSAGHLAAR